MRPTHRVELAEQSEDPLHAAEARPLAGRGGVVAVLNGLEGRVEAGQALALLQHALVGRLEEAVEHLFWRIIGVLQTFNLTKLDQIYLNRSVAYLISVEALRQVLERQLLLHVTASGRILID